MNYIFTYNVVFNDLFKSINYVNSFCESLRRINFDGKIVIFTESPQRLSDVVKGMNNVELVPVEEILNRFHNDVNYPLIRGLEDLSIKRVIIKKMYIQENGIKNDDNILFVDSRDAIFQSDPFQKMTTSKLTFGEEPLPYINDWSSPQYEVYKFNDSLYSSIMNCKVTSINSGFFIGSVGNFVKLVDDFINEILYIKNNVPYVNTKIPVCDQIIINKLLKINEPDYCEILPHQNPIIINHLLDGTFTYDGKMVYVKDNPVCVVHQYDRNSVMFKLLSDQYAI